uniref:Uncharacterized protein n=1 Tax=Romanomermis culicivorax TaxID=13658 RepID=A0A915LCD8_ROMCU
MKQARRKHPYIVRRLTHDDFFDLKQLHTNTMNAMKVDKVQNKTEVSNIASPVECRVSNIRLLPISIHESVEDDRDENMECNE